MTPRTVGIVSALLVSAAWATPVAAQTAPMPTKPDPERPPVTLVLSGGGARGAAHVGVLRALEELQVPVDFIVGTSMGAVVGGLYSAGYSPLQIEGVMQSIDWAGVFSDSIPYRDKSFRRKQDDSDYLVRGSIRFDADGPYLPLGVFQGRRIELIFKSIQVQLGAAGDFDQLPIPYRAVAADLATSEVVVLDHGSLATAIRASMSIPGVFAPVEIDGRFLVDGGVSANLPVRVAQGLSEAPILAVDISSPLDPNFRSKSFISVFQRMTAFLTAGNVELDRAALRRGDYLLTPDLGGLSFADFQHMERAIEAGYRSTMEHADELRRFAADEARWAAWERDRRRVRSPDLRIDRLEIHNGSDIRDDVIRARLEEHVGAPLDTGGLSTDLMALHGLELFGQIEYDVVERDGDVVLVVDVDPPEYGRHSLRFGLGVVDDFEGENGYNIVARHRMLPANPLGGEWLNQVQAGEEQWVRTEFYQPLDERLAWFVAPQAEVGRSNFPVWVDGKVISELWLESLGGRVDVGRAFASWGEVRIGGFWFDRELTDRIGIPGLFEYDGVDAGVRAMFRVDTFDAPIFPTSGWGLDARVEESLTGMGADVDFTAVSVETSAAWTLGRFTLAPGIEAYRSTGDNDSLFAVRGLGGFGRLSAYGTDELFGQEVALVRILGFQELFDVNLAGLRTRLYAGLSYETGNAWFEEDADLDDLLWSSTVFLGADTLLGPMYFGYAIGGDDRDRWYFNIGASF